MNMKSMCGIFQLCMSVTVGFGSAQMANARDTELKQSSIGKHLFILSGQSNMREPLIGTFAESVKKALGDEKVIVTSFGQPSQPILRWYRKWRPPEGVRKPEGGAEAYDRLMLNVQKSIKGQELASATLVWMQGEEDARLGFGIRYEESFLGILDQLKTDLSVDEVNFVIGRINDYWVPGRGIVDGDAIRALQVKLGESHKNGAWIDTDDLNTGVNPWGTYEIDGGHFPNPGYRVMGQRFAHAACKLVAPEMKLEKAIFAEALIDDARKVKGNLALGKAITGTKPDASHRGGESGLAALTDGKLGDIDPQDPAWLAFPPTEKQIRFDIDLGQPTDVSSVAINVLVNHQASAHFPVRIDISISADGRDYRHLLSGRSSVVSFDKRARQLNLASEFKPQPSLILVDKQASSVRYLKVEIVPDAASNSWVFVDEIMVNPVAR